MYITGNTADLPRNVYNYVREYGRFTMYKAMYTTGDIADIPSYVHRKRCLFAYALGMPFFTFFYHSND